MARFWRRKGEQPSSFYGRHKESKVKMSPEIDIPYPVNDAYGPHMVVLGDKEEKKQ